MKEDSNKLVEEAFKAVRDMKVRGAGKIARFAVQALIQLSNKSEAQNSGEFMKELNDASTRLISSRPTAVSLPNGIRYVMSRAKQLYKEGVNLNALKKCVESVGNEFIDKSLKAINSIAKYGSKRISNDDVVMTHCNSSVVTSILTEAHKAGKEFEVYVTETRPRYQGRLTAKELIRNGIPCTLIVDSAARYYMSEMNKVYVGADAVSANGALVNKIGTSLIALSAHEARVEFLAAAETYKFSPETLTGGLIWIEERPSEEILPKADQKEMGGLRIRNPSFDVTPPAYIDAIVTEIGVIPPQAAYWILQKVYGTLSSEELASYKTIHPEEP